MSPADLPPPERRRLLMTMFGWNESGGGTMLPRLIAAELVRRGWEVSVFHAGVAPLEGEPPYAVREWEQDGVRLVGVHNRPSVLFDIADPLRELDDPHIRAHFRRELDRFQPHAIHFHNLHNLGASLIDEASVRGVPTFFTTHNYWLICPRAYLLHGSGEMCPGPGDGTRCAACTGNPAQSLYARRLNEIRSRVQTGITRVFAVSDAVRRTLIAGGYDPEAITVVRQAMPAELEIWDQVGRDRPPGPVRPELTVAFIGSAYPHKGPQLLVQAAQLTSTPVRVRIIGEVPSAFADHLTALDSQGAVEQSGPYGAADLPGLLSDVDVAVLPSQWWDCAPLAATEAKAARLPLVVPRLGGLPECVRDGIDGLTFAGLDPHDLAAALERLASEPGLLERLQAAIEPPMAFAAHVDELEARYASAAEGSPPQDREPREPTAVAVRWKGDHGLPTSLSIINDQVTARLPGAMQRVARSGQALDPPLPHAADVEVRHEWPPDLSPPPAGRLAAIVPWEFGAIPSDWLAPIQRHVDELWVPSEYVRRMYTGAGIDPERVRVIPNGVDLELFHPGGPLAPRMDAGSTPSASERATRFLFVGGVTGRKGTDLLMRAWDEAFGERDDAVLVFKAAAAAGAYGGPSAQLRAWSARERASRVELIEDDLGTEELAGLYRSCEVFVLPYRGEGFAMPVLEAMASGLPTIVTAGGPTDEFCPEEAGWRIRSARKPFEQDQIDGLATVGRPWLLEPEAEHLVELLRVAADAGRDELARRGAIARSAAERYSWDAVAAAYGERIGAIASTRARRTDLVDEPFPLESSASLRVLATPAWRGHDALDELLGEWAADTAPETDACLYLLADPEVAGSSEELEGLVLAAADRSGVDLDRCADVEILVQGFTSDRDQRLHRTMDAYVWLHAGCDARARFSNAFGKPVLRVGTGELRALLAG